MIGRGPLRFSHVLAISVLTAGLVCAGSFTHPSVAFAAAGDMQNAVTHVVTFNSDGAVTQHATSAATVGDFLRERGITPAPLDFVSPALDTPLTDRLTVSYNPARTVTLKVGNASRKIVTTAPDVGALLESQHVRLGPNDAVFPALIASVPDNGTVSVSRVLTWQRIERHRFDAETQHHLDFSMQPGSERVVASGVPGVREVTVRYTQRDGGSVQMAIVGSHVARAPKPRVIAMGVGEYEAFQRFANLGVQRTSYLAVSALRMVATAYTAGCSGCSGITASGRPAGHGIVAVDPSVIPLGTRLYIPGYGFAVAGDTGGAIRGNRIDLGFNSTRDALLFGRREVVVYKVQ